MELFSYIIAILSSLLIFIILSKPYKIGTLINLIDQTKKYPLKIHTANTAPIGGFAIFLLFVNLCIYEINAFGINEILIAKYTLFFTFFLIGLIDDYIDLRPLTKIFLYSAVSLLCLQFENNVQITKIYTILQYDFIYLKGVSIFFTILCLLSLQNFLNMSDGINGYLSTYTAIILSIILFLNFDVTYLIFVIVLLMILIVNLQNKIFLGNNGSSIISAILAYFIIFTHQNINHEFLSAENILILLFIPFVDFFRLFINRLINRKNPLRGDLNHFHHIVLLKMPYKKWSILLTSFILGSYILSTIINAYIVIIFMSLFYYYLLRTFQKK